VTCPRVVSASGDGKQLVLCGKVLDEERCCPVHGGPAVIFAERPPSATFKVEHVVVQDGGEIELEHPFDHVVDADFDHPLIHLVVMRYQQPPDEWWGKER
jgi:hypothetical protein